MRGSMRKYFITVAFFQLVKTIKNGAVFAAQGSGTNGTMLSQTITRSLMFPYMGSAGTTQLDESH
jgi:hypothetical protein